VKALRKEFKIDAFTHSCVDRFVMSDIDGRTTSGSSEWMVDASVFNNTENCAGDARNCWLTLDDDNDAKEAKACFWFRQSSLFNIPAKEEKQDSPKTTVSWSLFLLIFSSSAKQEEGEGR